MRKIWSKKLLQNDILVPPQREPLGRCCDKEKFHIGAYCRIRLLAFVNEFCEELKGDQWKFLGDICIATNELNNDSLGQLLDGRSGIRICFRVGLPIRVAITTGPRRQINNFCEAKLGDFVQMSKKQLLIFFVLVDKGEQNLQQTFHDANEHGLRLQLFVNRTLTAPEGDVDVDVERMGKYRVEILHCPKYVLLARACLPWSNVGICGSFACVNDSVQVKHFIIAPAFILRA